MTGFKVGRFKAVLLVPCLAAGSTAAQDANQIFLNATYLAHPTDWCPPTVGVPLVVKMDGPDIVKGPKDWRRTIIVNKGGKVSESVTGARIESLIRPEDFEGQGAQVIGRFSADFRVCLSVWGRSGPAGSWRLNSINGEELSSGTFEGSLAGRLYPAFFHQVRGTSKAYYVRFGDHLLFTASKPTITQTFAAEPEKE